MTDGRSKDLRMATVFASARVGEHVPGAETERIVELAIGQQSSIRGDPGTMELELYTTVEIDPHRIVALFTRVRHDDLMLPSLTR